MKYTIEGFSQEKLLDLNLDITDAMILRWFIDFRDTDRMRKAIYDGQEYCWINHGKIINDLPILGITTPKNISRHLMKLVDSGVLLKYLRKYSGGTYTYYKVNESVYTQLITHETNRGGARGQIGEVPEDISGHPNNSSINDSSINDIYTESKQEDISKKELPTESITLANLLYDLHKTQVDEKYVVSPNQLLKWSEEIEKLHRLDNRSWDEIEMVIRWCKNDDFWKSNIMSGGTLRKQFPKLIARVPKMKTSPPPVEEPPKQYRPPFNAYCMSQIMRRDAGQPHDSELLDLIFGDDQGKIDGAEAKYKATGNWRDV